MPAEIFRIGSRQKRTLMMIEPPGDFGGVGILEIDDRVLVAVEHLLIKEDVAGSMKQRAVLDFSAWMDSFLVEAAERCR